MCFVFKYKINKEYFDFNNLKIQEELDIAAPFKLHSI
jgi:hypothetical protein